MEIPGIIEHLFVSLLTKSYQTIYIYHYEKNEIYSLRTQFSDASE